MVGEPYNLLAETVTIATIYGKEIIMKNSFCIGIALLVWLFFLTVPPMALSHDCGGCKHDHSTDTYSTCTEYNAACKVDGKDGTCKQYTRKCVCEKSRAAADDKAVTKEAKPKAGTKFGGVPRVMDDKDKRGNQCVYVCKAKSSLTGELTVCGWGKSDSCSEAELGARQGCRMSGWSPPYTCGQW
jgi:hypothetical protein